MSLPSRGTVKWFNPAKGFGFIHADSGVDVFVSGHVVETSRCGTLRPGDIVDFDSEPEAQGRNPRATAVEIYWRPPEADSPARPSRRP